MSVYQRKNKKWYYNFMLNEKDAMGFVRGVKLY
jgi:hypothetical protein